MVTPLTLQHAVNKFLQKEVGDTILLRNISSDEGAETFKNPTVVMGYIMPKEARTMDNEEHFPYIVTRITEVKHAKGSLESVITLAIYFGAYCPGSYKSGEIINDGSGYTDVLNMMARTEQALFAQGIIDKKYRIMEEPFVYKMYDEQVYPYWEGEMTTSWHVCFTQEQENK